MSHTTANTPGRVAFPGRRQQRRFGASLIRHLNFDNIPIPQLMLLTQLYFAGDLDHLPRLRLDVGFVRPQDDSRPAKYFAGHDTDRDRPAVLFRL